MTISGWGRILTGGGRGRFRGSRVFEVLANYTFINCLELIKVNSKLLTLCYLIMG